MIAVLSRPALGARVAVVAAEHAPGALEVGIGCQYLLGEGRRPDGEWVADG